MKNVTPKVSVIIPVYNVEAYLWQCLDSVSNQTLRDIEIICVDDGSTDGSGKILDQYAEKDNRIQLIHKKNEGAGASRNVGLAMATGEYLLFLDSDDYFRLDMLEKMYEQIKTTNAQICVCRAQLYKQSQNKIEEMPWLVRLEAGVYERTKIDNIFHVINPNCWNKLFSHKFITKNGLRFQNLHNCNDVYFTWMAVSLAEKICVTNDKFITYRTNTYNQISNSINPKCILQALTALKLTIKDEKILSSLYQSSFDHFLYALHAVKSKIKIVSFINNYIKFYPKNMQKDMREKLFTCLRVKYQHKIHWLQKVFSVKNKGIHKVVMLCGLKITCKSNKLIERERFRLLNYKLDALISKMDKITITKNV